MKSIKFYWDSNDSEFVLTSDNVSNIKPNNLISNVYIRSPIYNKCNQKVGYIVSNSVIQQLSVNQFSVRINQTFYLEGEGTITWDYSFINSKFNVLYLLDDIPESTIVSGTGKFVGAKGLIKIIPKPDGKRLVTVNIY